MRPGLGHIFRGHALGAIRMAFLLHRSWRRQHGVACSLVRMDPARTYRRFPRRTKRRRISRTPDATIDVGTCGGLFGANYVLYFEITWLPFYLVRERHRSMGTMAKIGGVGYLCYSAAAVAFGWISDRWIAAGGTPTLVRKTFAGVGAGSAGLLLLGCALAGPTVSVILLLLAFAAGGMCGSNIWAITQTLAGPRMAGRWTGFQNFLGNLAGIIAPAVTGFVVDFSGRFFMAFVIMAIVALLAALSYFFVIGPVKEIAWHERPASEGA